MRLSDILAVQQIVQQRDDLVRVAIGIDKAKTFQIVMSTTESGNVSCDLPSTFAPDVAVLINKQVAQLDNQLRGYGVDP